MAGAPLKAHADDALIYEARFNEPGDLDFQNGASLGADRSGVSGKPGDKAYSAEVAEGVEFPEGTAGPMGVMTEEPLTVPDPYEEMTVTCWYKAHRTIQGAANLFSALGGLLIWDENVGQWVLRIRATVVNDPTTTYWFYSGNHPPLIKWGEPGEWIFFAATWRREGSRVAFYQGDKHSGVVLAKEQTREESGPIEMKRPSRNVIGNDWVKRNRSFNGRIDNLRFYSKALDQETLEKLRKADLNNEPAPLH